MCLMLNAQHSTTSKINHTNSVALCIHSEHMTVAETTNLRSRHYAELVNKFTAFYET